MVDLCQRHKLQHPHHMKISLRGPTGRTKPTTSNWLPIQINCLVGPQEPLLATVRTQKLAWFRRVTHHDYLSKTILQGTLEGGGNVVNRRNTGLTMSKIGHTCPCLNCHQQHPAEDWKRISTESSLTPLPPTPHLTPIS